LYYKGYLVSDEGKIEMPVIGKIDVVNKTLGEIQTIIQTKTMEYFKEVYVT
jgi:protein involved in polysaccharide export with SLBB domain